MKKIITLCIFVFALFTGTQTIEAQNSKLEIKKEINAKAAKKTEALRKFIKFSNDQRDDIYIALRTYGEAKFSTKETEANKEEIAKIEKQLDDKVKTILSEEQYERYKTYSEQN